MFLDNLFKRKPKPGYNSLAAPLLQQYNEHRPLGPQKYVCYAPFKSIYFGHHGRAIACCYNRTHLLGEYPKNTIKEIWFGEEADKLREYIKHNDLSLGCTGCKQHLVAGNFDAVKAKQYDERTSNRNHYPSVMEFELSNICNLECEMCSGDFSSLIRSKREKLPPLENAYDENFVKQLEEFIPYLDEVKFYGGEPFLIEIYYQIWEKIMEINPKVRISVQTNATVLNNRVKRILENTDFHINVSFDSLQKETYESIRINADFERTFENLKWFREYSRSRNTFFGVSMCAMKQNWRELPDFITFCNDLDVPVYFHTVFFPTHCSIREMNAWEIKEVSDYLAQFSFPADTPVQQKNLVHYEGIKSQIASWYENAPSRTKIKTDKLETLTDLESLVIEHIRNDQSQEESKRAARIKNIKEKFAVLNAEIDPVKFREITDGIRRNDPFLFDNIAFQIESIPAAQLVLMAKANFK